MNPCPCGQLGNPAKACHSPDAVLRYQSRISGPLLDRIDLQVEVPSVEPDRLAAAADGEPSEVVRRRVAAARAGAQARQGCANAQLAGDALDLHGRLDDAAARLLQGAAARLGWSARGFHRVLRIARTIAHLAGNEAIAVANLAEAIQYRRVLQAQ